MDSLDPGLADALLDFPLDLHDPSPNPGQTRESLGDFFDATDESLPSVTNCLEEEEEEELEWIANEDAFPTLDTFDIPTRKPSPGLKHQSPVSVLESSFLSCGFPRVPGKARSKRRRRRHGVACIRAVASEASRGAPLPPPPGQPRRRCLHCQADKTPQWRAGPMGPKTLCNACGVRFKSGRLVPEYRPASSPTFSNELHSNSHRKIMEMRRLQHKGCKGQITIKRGC